MSFRHVLMTSAASLTLAVPAFAQDAAETTAPSVTADRVTDLPGETIVITASPLERTVNETIIGTSVVDQDALARQFQNTIAETITREPGVSSTFFGPAASRPIIRGLGDGRIRVLDNGIGAIDASVASPDHAVAIDPSSATQVEIVRGPSMLLYGSSAAGGVVNVISGRIPTETPDGGFDVTGTAGLSTADDGFDFSGAFDLEVGKFAGGSLVLHGDGFYREAEDFDIPGFAESAALRAQEEAEEAEDVLTFADDDEDEEEEAFGTVPNSFFETSGGSGGLSWVSDRGYFGVSGTFIDSEYGLPGAKKKEEEEEGEEEEEAEEEEGAGFIDLRQRRIDLAGAYDFDGWIRRATARFGYADYEHTEFEGPGEPGTIFSNEGWEGRVELINRDSEIWGGLLQGVQGVQFIRRDFSALGEEAFVPPTETFQFGIFQQRAYLNGPWRVELGTRFEYTNHENTVTGEEADFNGLSTSIGLGYQATDAIFVGATVSRTERAPTTEELFSNGPHLATGTFDVGDPTLEEEVALGVEATVRYVLDRFRFSVNGFYTSYDDFILFDETGEEEDGLPVFLFQGVDATFRGFEAEVDAELFRFRGFDIHADVGLDFVRATRDGGVDEDLPRIPPLSAVLGLEARHDYGDLRFELEAAAEQDDVAAFELPTESYQLFNIYATLRPFGPDSPVSVRMIATNLTDEEARLHPSFLKDTVPLRGRNFRIAFTASF
ncbi:MAG: TonB-dependent receptor [Alphaproteobacteria bacterium]